MAFELMKAVPARQRAPMLTLMGWLKATPPAPPQARRQRRPRLPVLMQELINRGTIAEAARNVEASYKRGMI